MARSTDPSIHRATTRVAPRSRQNPIYIYIGRRAFPRCARSELTLGPIVGWPGTVASQMDPSSSTGFIGIVSTVDTPQRGRVRAPPTAGSHWLESYRIGSGPSHPRVRVVVGSYVVCHHWRPSNEHGRSIGHNCAVVMGLGLVVVPLLLYRCSSSSTVEVVPRTVVVDAVTIHPPTTFSVSGGTPGDLSYGSNNEVNETTVYMEFSVCAISKERPCRDDRP